MEITARQFPYNTGVVSRKAFDDHIMLYEGYVHKTNEVTHVLATQPEYETANATANNRNSGALCHWRPIVFCEIG